MNQERKQLGSTRPANHLITCAMFRWIPGVMHFTSAIWLILIVIYGIDSPELSWTILKPGIVSRHPRSQSQRSLRISQSCHNSSDPDRLWWWASRWSWPRKGWHPADSSRSKVRGCLTDGLMNTDDFKMQSCWPNKEAQKSALATRWLPVSMAQYKGEIDSVPTWVVGRLGPGTAKPVSRATLVRTKSWLYDYIDLYTMFVSRGFLLVLWLVVEDNWAERLPQATQSTRGFIDQREQCRKIVKRNQ